MADPNTSMLFVIVAAALVGTTALLLVSGELARRAGIGTLGRVALACGLGLGVIFFSAKVGIYIFLNTLDRGEIGTIQSWRLQPAARAASTRVPSTTASRVARKSNFRAWQALPRVPESPRDNPFSLAKAALGKKLFFDRRLSKDGTISCASCHRISGGGDDDTPVSGGVGGKLGDRNSPSVLNAAYLSRLFWDGRAGSLEEQAKGPFINPVEMAMPSHQAVEDAVRSDPAYRAAFAALFDGEQPITIDTIVKAIAAFERTLVTPDTAYDRYVRGDDSALTAQQVRGMALFADVGCRDCHVDPTFSSAGTIKPRGVYRVFPVHPDSPLIGKYDLLINEKPHRWRVPSLRNVDLTAPYFHNGSVATLEEAIRVMAVSQLGRSLSDDPDADVIHLTSRAGGGVRVTSVSDRALSEREIGDIAAFLRSLTSLGDSGKLNMRRNGTVYAASGGTEQSSSD